MMSIFSPCSSFITLRTRWAHGADAHAPLALTAGTIECTAILVRCPASRAIPATSTVPSADLGHLEGEQLADQVGVGAREHHLRAAHATAHGHDQALDPGAVGVVLPWHPFPRRQQRLEGSEVDQHVVGVASLLDQPGDDVALLAEELAELHLVLGVAHPLEHDLLRRRGGDPAEPLGSVVVLPCVARPPRRRRRPAR